MFGIFRFFIDNIIWITIVTLIMLAALVIFTSLNPSGDILPDPSKKEIEKVVTIETYSDLNKTFDSILSNSDVCNQEQLENTCTTLNNNHCKMSSCCVLRKPLHSIVTTTPALECVAGNSNGPIFHSIGDNPIQTDYYYYKGNCYDGKGSCPSNNK